MRNEVLFIALLASGCATKVVRSPEPIIITKEVFIPVPVACVPKELGEPPEYPDDDKSLIASASPEERYQRILAGRELRRARQGETEPVISICRRAAK